MNKTPICWVKNPDGTQGYTWNPITGCLNGCEYCYARKLANGRLKARYLANRTIAGIEHVPLDREGMAMLLRRQTDPFYPRFWEDRLSDKGLGMCESPPKKKWGIFVCDMSDLFGIGIPEEWTRKVLYQIRLCERRHRFYLLTKQPQNLIKFQFPDNCWVGVSFDGVGSHTFRAIQSYLLKVEAKVKFVSFEPLLDWYSDDKYLIENNIYHWLDWVIIGVQTKPYKPPKIEWVEEIESACNKAGIAVFEKDNLKPLLDYNLRQEMPNADNQPV